MPSIHIKIFHPKAKRINAVIDGYCQHHRLNVAELDYLSEISR
jgi:hypothetical protein